MPRGGPCASGRVSDGSSRPHLAPECDRSSGRRRTSRVRQLTEPRALIRQTWKRASCSGVWSRTESAMRRPEERRGESDEPAATHRVAPSRQPLRTHAGLEATLLVYPTHEQPEHTGGCAADNKPSCLETRRSRDGIMPSCLNKYARRLPITTPESYVLILRLSTGCTYAVY